jgi:hypothetical protein
LVDAKFSLFFIAVVNDWDYIYIKGDDHDHDRVCGASTNAPTKST